VDVIVASSTAAALAAKQATTVVPIVFCTVPDPVATGLVTSLARPGGNVTGLSNLNADLVGKCLEYLTQAVPGVSRVAVLWQPGAFGERTEQEMLKASEVAARALGIQLQFVEARGPADIDKAFSEITGARADAVTVLVSGMLLGERKHLVRRESQISSGFLVVGAIPCRDSWSFQPLETRNPPPRSRPATRAPASSAGFASSANRRLPPPTFTRPLDTTVKTLGDPVAGNSTTMAGGAAELRGRRLGGDDCQGDASVGLQPSGLALWTSRRWRRRTTAPSAWARQLKQRQRPPRAYSFSNVNVANNGAAGTTLVVSNRQARGRG
jgi:ABC transporter substrate binding protein